MNNNLDLQRFPIRVRYGLFFFIGGWVWHFFFIYLLFVAGRDDPATQIVYQQVAIGGLLCYFLYRVKKWARVLCLLCNSLIILLYLCFAALFWTQRPQLVLMSLGVIGCFAAASYLLMTREAITFYAGGVKDSDSRDDTR